MNMADVALDLSAAMRENPNLKVYSLNGIYDFATPFFGTEYDLGHMQLNAATKGNVKVRLLSPRATWSTSTPTP